MSVRVARLADAHRRAMNDLMEKHAAADVLPSERGSDYELLNSQMIAAGRVEREAMMALVSHPPRDLDELRAMLAYLVQARAGWRTADFQTWEWQVFLGAILIPSPLGRDDAAAENSKGPAEAATSPDHGSTTIYAKEAAMNGSELTGERAAKASPAPHDGVPRQEARQARERDAFDRMFHAWRLAEFGLGPDASDDEVATWESVEEDDRRLQQALDIVQAPAPHVYLLGAKLDVLLHYGTGFGPDLSPVERLLIRGLCALRADIVNFGG